MRHPNRLLVILITAGLILFLFVQNTQATELVVIVWILFVLLDLLVFRLTSGQYQIHLETVNDTVKPGLIRQHLVYTGENRLLLCRVSLSVRTENQLLDEYRDTQFRLVPLQGRKNVINFTTRSSGCGRISTQVREVCRQDWLGLATKKCDTSGIASSAVIIPETAQMQVDETTSRRAESQAEYDLDRRDRDQDQGEIIDFKAYEPGDSVKNIHWKLSVRQQELMVKEFSQQAANTQLILLESHYYPTQEKAGAEVISALMTAFLSAAQTLAGQNTAYSLAWFDSGEERLKIADIGNFKELMLQMDSISNISYRQSERLVLDDYKAVTERKWGQLLYITAGRPPEDLPEDIAGSMRTLLIRERPSDNRGGQKELTKPAVPAESPETVIYTDDLLANLSQVIL